MIDGAKVRLEANRIDRSLKGIDKALKDIISQATHETDTGPILKIAGHIGEIQASIEFLKIKTR